MRNEPHESHHHHHRSQQLQNHSNNARDPARRQTNDIKSSIHQNSDGNLLISIPKTKASIGIAIEGGANTKHPLPRIINIHVSSFLTHYFLLVCYIFYYLRINSAFMTQLPKFNWINFNLRIKKKEVEIKIVILIK